MIGESSDLRQPGRNSAGRNGSGAKGLAISVSSAGMNNTILRTTTNESWKLAWNSCSGCQMRMIRAAAASEFKRWVGRFMAQPRITSEDMMAERIAELCQPVAPV